MKVSALFLPKSFTPKFVQRAYSLCAILLLHLGLLQCIPVNVSDISIGLPHSKHSVGKQSKNISGN